MYLSKIAYYKFIPRESFNFVDFLLLLDVDIGSTIKKTGVVAFKKTFLYQGDILKIKSALNVSYETIMILIDTHVQHQNCYFQES